MSKIPIDRVIKNFDSLATSSLRKQLLTIAEAGYEAINTKKAISRALAFDANKNVLVAQNRKFVLSGFKRIFVLAFGKAALESAMAIKEILGDRIYFGMVIDVNVPADKQEGKWLFRQATHPHVSEQNVDAALEALANLSGLSEDDLVICSISGGGSAIFEVPYKISADQAARVFKAMTQGGATISELNVVRKHMSRVKGGQLAKAMHPATIINLMFSDVPGDDLSVIASGPLIKDPTALLEAKTLIEKFEVLKLSGLDKIDLIETPKEEKYFERVFNILAVSPKAALNALREKAELLGWEVKIFSDKYQGEARVLAGQILGASQQGQCLLGAGESTVKILGQGKGGRNQEMALAALSLLKPGQALGCFASDGHDNTEAAGAIVDESVKQRAYGLLLTAESFLNNNDSFNFFEKTGDLVQTGLTGSNVADFFVCLWEKN